MNEASHFFPKTSEETMAIGSTLAKNLEKGTCVFLRGELGAGKTTFVKGMASAFNCPQNNVSSPTFQYLHIYEGTKTMYHFDLDRVENKTSFFDLGFHEFVESDAISCIEWPERLSTYLPKKRVEVNISHDKEGRLIEICQK